MRVQFHHLVKPYKGPVITPNVEKAHHESWTPGRYEFNIPHPFRAVLVGPPNSGKTVTVKTLAYHARPQFDIIKLIHLNGEQREYDWVDEVLEEIPDREWFYDQTDDGEGGRRKMLCILEDLEFSDMSKEQRICLSVLLRNVSTHASVSVIITSQTWTAVQPNYRRLLTLFVFWPGADHNENHHISRKMGADPKKIMAIIKSPRMQDGSDTPHQERSIWVDRTGTTGESPHPFRINGFSKHANVVLAAQPNCDDAPASPSSS